MEKSKKILNISIVLIIIGTFLVVVGYLNGGYKSIIINSSGVKVYDDINVVKINEDLESFKNIEVFATYCDINIIPSDKFRIEMAYPETSGQVKYSVANDKLTISQENTDSNLYINFGIISTPSSYINVYVPSDMAFEVIKLESKSSDLDIKSIVAKELNINLKYGDLKVENIQADSVICNMNSGEMELSNLNVKNNLSIDNSYGDMNLYNSNVNSLITNLNSGTVKIKNSKIQASTIDNKYGDVEISDIASKGMKVTIGSGDIDLSGELIGATTIDSKYGDIDIETELSENEYSYSGITKYGEVRINNTSFDSNYSKNNSDKNKIEVKAQSGDIDIMFKN